MRKFTSKACLLLIALLSPAVIQAAGLGRLTVTSALGHPFSAEIDLVAVKKEEQHSLMARLASPDTFRHANVDYVPLLSTFKTSIENRPNGQPYVKIISPQSITEPFLNMLIELNWPSGRLLREYTVLLTPPEIDVPSSGTSIGQLNQSPASGSANSTKAESAAAEKSALPIKSPVMGEKRPVTDGPTGKTHTVYGPVKRGETLVRIVQNIVPPPGMSINQMLVALHRANRDAFLDNNMHRLKAGSILRIPDDSEIGAITPVEADKEVKLQTTYWNRYKLADLIDLRPAAGELRQTVTGKIGSDVEADVVAQESANEILKLSRGEAPWDADKIAGAGNAGGMNAGGKGGMEVSGVQNRRLSMEEESVAKSRSLNEANERVALLEKNIKELERLLELKSVVLAGMQKRVEAIVPDGTMPSGPPVAISSQDAPTPEPLLETQAAPLIAEAGNVDEAAITPLAAGEPATEIAEPMHAQAIEKPGQAAASTPERPVKSSLIDDMTANIEYLGGALVLLITGIVGVSVIGRSKEASPENSSMEISPAFDSPLHGKAMPEAPVATTMGISSETAAAEADEIDSAARAEAYPDNSNIQTAKIKDASAGDHGRPIRETLSVPLTQRAVEAGLMGVSFDLDAIRRARSEEFVERNTRWHEIVTKLDLARAYQEMGDKEAARQVLREVAHEGDVQQQESARRLLAGL